MNNARNFRLSESQSGQSQQVGQEEGVWVEQGVKRKEGGILLQFGALEYCYNPNFAQKRCQLIKLIPLSDSTVIEFDNENGLV